jgi:hypothetical protein
LPYKEVFDDVVRLLGRDPQGEVKPDMARTIASRINDRVRTICPAWRWPQWELTEERAFRQVWNNTHQYLRATTVDGKPDELFYIGVAPNYTGQGYYVVNVAALGDPPVGTPPTNTTYFSPLTPVDTFIAYDQTCKRSIGMVLGVYSQNPRVPTGSKCGGLRFEPSERGVDVISTNGPTVFVTYKMPTPKYTIIPWVTGKTYVRAQTVFDIVTGECFQALDSTTALVSDILHWRRIPFPEEWNSYVTQGAFADCLMEFDQGGNADAQVKMLLSQSAEQKAGDGLQTEVDTLVIQGQKLQWNFCQKTGCCCESQPWNGGTVTTLSSVCEDELGWIYPLPPAARDFVLMGWTPTIQSLIGPAQPALNTIPTANLPLNSGKQISIMVGGSLQEQTWQLQAGAADPTDPGHVQPLDYDAARNNVFWYKIG